MSFFNLAHQPATAWKPNEKILFRFFFFFFVLLAIPLDLTFYSNLFSIKWLDLNFYDLFRLTRYHPSFFGIEGYGSWLIAAVIAIAGTVIWTLRWEEKFDYNVLYYWLRVILRYRLALGLVAYGLIKLFPLQMPYPSLSNLHTNYGDFFPWKIYYHTLGIVPGYESFLGAVEVLAAILLLFRKTTTFGAGIILGFTGNVFAANIAYDGGEQVYSAYLFIIALFLFAYDAPRLYRLLVLGRFTYANRFKPVFSEKAVARGRHTLKGLIAVFIIALGITTYGNYTHNPYKVPSTPGLDGAYGFYNVREFRFNNNEIPYSTIHPQRWQNVVFEKWATISIKIARPVRPDLSTGDQYHAHDIDRNFESAGVGGRHYYAYTIDSANQELHLENKNPNHRGEKFTLRYSFASDSTIVLQGVNEQNDSIYAVLDRINKKYLLQEGRRKRVKL